ncbi:MAG TPA: polysaccharide deacetylase family protein [Solirubrobacterales bacterium]
MTDEAWPGGARGALALSFDNLGEAAEIELGAFPEDAPLGEHFTATAVLPRVLEALAEHDLAATFFVEGLNAELYPEALRKIGACGHEVAFHAWRHEDWATLSASEQADNLERGVGAFAELGLRLSGMRPPGGGLGAGGTGVLSRAGLDYCSPAGRGAGTMDGVALLPFEWRHVDASCLLPPMAQVREQIAGTPEPLEPETFLDHLLGEIERLGDEGGFMAIVLHLSMFDWLGGERLKALLDRVATAAGDGVLWVSRSDSIAEHMLDRRDAFRGRTVLDPLSWGGRGAGR